MATNRRPTFADASASLVEAKNLAYSIIDFKIPEQRLVDRGVKIHDLYIDGREDDAIAEINSFISEINGRIVAFLVGSSDFFDTAAKFMQRDGFDTDLIGKFNAGRKELSKIIIKDDPNRDIPAWIKGFNDLKSLYAAIVAEHSVRQEKARLRAEQLERERREHQRRLRQEEAGRFLVMLGVPNVAAVPNTNIAA